MGWTGGMAQRMLGDPISHIHGRVGGDIVRVIAVPELQVIPRILSKTGAGIEATVADGYFVAWWPGTSKDSDSVKLTAYRADGSSIDVGWGTADGDWWAINCPRDLTDAIADYADATNRRMAASFACTDPPAAGSPWMRRTTLGESGLPSGDRLADMPVVVVGFSNDNAAPHYELAFDPVTGEIVSMLAR